MTGMQRASGYPIGNVRGGDRNFSSDRRLVSGGTVGIGTVIFAMMIGPTVAVCLNISGEIGRQQEQ